MGSSKQSPKPQVRSMGMGSCSRLAVHFVPLQVMANSLSLRVSEFSRACLRKAGRAGGHPMAPAGPHWMLWQVMFASWSSEPACAVVLLATQEVPWH